MTAIHDATPTQALLQEQHKERLKRMNAAAAPTVPVLPQKKPVETFPIKTEAQVIRELRAQVYALTMQIDAEKVARQQEHQHLLPDEPDPVARPTIASIKEAVAKYFDVTMKDLEGQTREVKYLGPRHVAMYLARALTVRSLPFIGLQFDGRDHTTVLSAVRKVTLRRATDEKLNADLVALEKLFA